MLKQHSQLVGHEAAATLFAETRNVNNYDRKLKPTTKKTRKTRQKRRKHLKTALLALGMFAIIPSVIAGSALTDVKQVPNVVTQATTAMCAAVTRLTGGGWDTFGACMVGFWGGAAGYGALSARAQRVVDLARALVTYVRINPWGLVAAVA